MKKPTARTLIRDAIEGFRFFEGEDPAIPHAVRYGRNPLAVIVGSNGGGKSMLRRVIGVLCKQAGIEFIGLSMEARSAGGVTGAFIYGSENWEATGVNSLRTVTTGIKTCKGRDSDHVVFWDEPDTGMSDELAAAAGRKILAMSREKPKHTKAIFVVSHNRYLVRELLPANPHYVHIGSDPLDSLKAWTERTVAPVDPEKVEAESLARFRRISAMLKEKR